MGQNERCEILSSRSSHILIQFLKQVGAFGMKLYNKQEE